MNNLSGCDEAVFEKLKMPAEEVQNCKLTMLQKTAKSTCILKNTYILDKLMNARMKSNKNCYLGNFYNHTKAGQAEQ